MNAEEVPAILRNLEIPGASAKPADGKSGSGLELGFIVTGEHGARMAWQVALQNDGAQGGSGPVTFPEAIEAEPYSLVSAHVEASIAAWIGQSPIAPHVTALERYSSHGKKSGIRFGVALTLHTGGRVFIQLLWTLRPDEKPGPDNKYVLLDAV